jgi:6-pyruvoyltetrahydropterin/6-carboxytetrahydropterin synthase
MPEISKTISIEMGHRLQHHQGKCFNLHGHSYKIEFFIEGPAQKEGSETGMVVDYTVMKYALSRIDKIFDHTMCLQLSDPLVPLLVNNIEPVAIAAAEEIVASQGFTKVIGEQEQKYVLIYAPPTAETLASLWLALCIKQFNQEVYKFRMKVWETATSCCEVRYGWL